MIHNKNFHNEYDLVVEACDRDKVLSLIKKISDNKPGLIQESKYKIKENIKGDLYIYFGNVSAFDEPTLKVIKNFLNKFKYKKPEIKEENNTI